MALAQTQPTTTGMTAPNDINHAPRNFPGYRSGSESQQAARGAPARGAPARIVDRGNFCLQLSVTSLRCHYKTLASCKAAPGRRNLACVANPRIGADRAATR